jgi:hypothetical protein
MLGKLLADVATLSNTAQYRGSIRIFNTSHNPDSYFYQIPTKLTIGPVYTRRRLNRREKHVRTQAAQSQNELSGVAGF